MRSHVAKTVSACYSVLRQPRTIRGSVSRSVLQSLVSSLVLSRLDYGNLTLAGVSSCLLSRLQSVMNAAARLIFSSSRFPAHHSAPSSAALAEGSRADCIQTISPRVQVYTRSAPAYLTDEFCQVADVEARQRLRSSSSSSLIVRPRFGSTKVSSFALCFFCLCVCIILYGQLLVPLVFLSYRTLLVRLFSCCFYVTVFCGIK